MTPENQADRTMASGKRLQIAVDLAEASMRDGKACPPAALTKPASANVMAADAEWCAQRNAARTEAMQGHKRSPAWSYTAEVEQRIDQHLQRQRIGRTC